jgi:hypothetical protein
MELFLKWVFKEYVYVISYILIFILVIMGIISTNIILLSLSFLLFIGINNKIYKDWKKIKKRHDKIHNQKK